MIKLKRYEKNPILAPTLNPWEDKVVFNPGAIIHNQKVHLLYRALGRNSHFSRLGLAVSDDGINFERRNEPLYHGQNYPYEKVGVEDPRVVKIEDLNYVTYTSVVQVEEQEKVTWGENISFVPCVALATTKNFRYFARFDVIMDNLQGKDASLFPQKVNNEYWILFREGIDQTFFSTSKDLKNWPTRDAVFTKRPGFWDSDRAGIGAPPIKTEKGWLLFYHGVDSNKVYRLGIIFLDLNDPTKVIYRSDEPILEPEMQYEKKGLVNNVVFTCGAVEMNNMFYVYYGAADSLICLATIEKEAVLSLV